MPANHTTEVATVKEGFVVIDAARCKGCGLCLAACARGVLVMSSRLNGKGYTPAAIKQPQRCTGCGLCVLMCPDGAIAAYRKKG